MKLYWPCAIYKRPDGSEDKLFTYDSALSLNEAMKAIHVWQDAYKYNLKRCWIQVFEGDQMIDEIEVEI